MKIKRKKKAIHTVKALTGSEILKTLGISEKKYEKDIKEFFNEKKR